MWSSLQAPLFFGLIAAFVTTVGLLAVAQRSAWSERNSTVFGLVAGGMLVTLVLLHIAPEAFALSPTASWWMLTGFMGGLLLSYAIKAIFPEKPGMEGKAAAFTPVAAIAVHSFIDGIIYSVTFAADFASGVLASVALILHEFPEGVITFAILKRFGCSNRASFIWAFLAAAATTPLGVVASAPFMYGLPLETLGALFGVSAGLLLYVATGPLLSPMRDEPAARSLPAVGVGVAVAVGLALVPLHDHDHAHEVKKPLNFNESLQHGNHDGHDH